MLAPGAVLGRLDLCLRGHGHARLSLLPTAIHAGLPHNLLVPGCGRTAGLPLLLEGPGPAGHQGGAVEGHHRLAGLQGRPRPPADLPASLGA